MTESSGLEHVPEITKSEICVWVISGASFQAPNAKILQRLSTDELARARRFKSESHAAQWAFFHACLREILGSCTGRKPPELEFQLTQRDKPSLLDAGTPPLYFNLSHSGELALLAVTRRAPIGVDIEHMRALNDRDALVRRFFSHTEREAYASLPESDRHHCFYDIWTRKEAVIKANGVGLATPLDAFDVAVSDLAGWQLTNLRPPLPTDTAYPIYPIVPAEDYIGAVALEIPENHCGELPEVRVYDYQPVF